MIGQTISHYEIVEKLGEGGMGVVYKAQDTRLDRPVALKFLAPHLLRDEEGRKRFKREAKAAAALDHPNICTVHEIDEAEGRTFIAMAFLEGESLYKKIEQGPLKIPEALSIAIQVAEGLEAAHEKGVTHRDIKPDNIMLMAGSRGLVKIMDFGLAQLAGSSKFTREGTTLGTMLYMSPEQAGGAETDRRTDIWSLGVVLYEMIAGQPPFRGEFDQALVYSLMNEPPEPLTAVRTGVPKELERIVNKCLAKKPEQRFQHADELMVDLQAQSHELEPHTARVAAKPVVTKRTSPWVFGAAAVALLATVGLTWLVIDSYAPEPNAPPQYTLTQITRDSGYTGQPALSPDGKLLAYVSDRGGGGSLDLWVQQIAGGDPIRLTRTPTDVWGPSFSPDGSEIVYGGFLGEGGVYVVPALGGSARRLVAERGWNPKFSPQGESVAYSVGYENTTGAIYIVSSRGGQLRRLELDIPWAAWPIWSPDGNYLLFLGSLDPVPGGRGVDWWIAPSGGGRAVDLNVHDVTRKIGRQRQNSYALVRLNQARPLQWLADGNWVLFSASLGDSTNLWRIGISAREGRITTQPQRLTSGTNEAEPSASLDGRIAFTSIRSNFDVWSLPIDPNEAKPRGPLEKLIGGAPQDDYPSASDDGQRLVFVSDRSGNWDVWMKDLGSGTETPITITPEDERRGIISPDGARVAYIRREGTRTNLYAVPVVGGTEKRLSDDIGNLTGWTPDSQRVVYYSPGQRTQFRTVDLRTGEQVKIVQHPDYDVHGAAFSPDGRWLSLKLLIDPGRVESTHIAPVRDGKAVEPSQWIRITEGQYDSRNGWSPDGNILYFWSRRDGSPCLWAQRLAPETKKPVGSLMEVQHFHSPGRSVRPGGRWAFTKNRLHLPVIDMTGNIWLAEPQRAE